MGLVIMIVVGAILGWLAAIVVERDDRAGGALCLLAGGAGSVGAALIAGNVPLVMGVSASQLMWGVLGALFAIAAVNAAVVTRIDADTGNI